MLRNTVSARTPWGMTWGSPRSYPRAIIHIDGDSFFASCEVAKDPSLRGKPVITGKERGIVSACTYEAKARGVLRGEKLSDARRKCPEAIVLPSDYETYSLFSQRMYAIVRSYTPTVEEYSIDECFADITGLRQMHRMSYESIGQTIQTQLEQELGLTFSIGLSATKTLAKIGSKWKKPHGFTAIPLRDTHLFLKQLPVEKLWGIGPNTGALLRKFGVHTALDFATRDAAWAESHLSKPYVATWRELNGEVAYELDTAGRQGYQSIQKTKTFTPPSRDGAFIYSQLSKNVENACIKARRWGLESKQLFIFLKTQDFRYHAVELALARPTNLPHEVLAAVQEAFPKLVRRGVLYRTTGITLMNLTPQTGAQLDLFGERQKLEEVRGIYSQIDVLSQKYGKHAVFLGSSFTAMTHAAHLSERGDTPERTKNLFTGETTRRRLGLPMLGEV